MMAGQVEVWTAVIIAVITGAGLAIGCPALLRSLPAPEVSEPPDYAELADARFRAVMGLSCALALLVTLPITSPWLWPGWIGLGSVGVLLAGIDARTQFLPRRLCAVLAGCTAVSLAAAAWFSPPQAGIAVLLAASSCAGFWVLWRFGDGFGFGDVRLAPVIVALVGLAGVNAALLAVFLAGAVTVGYGLWLRIRNRPSSIPFGPGLVLGAHLTPLLAGSITQLGW